MRRVARIDAHHGIELMPYGAEHDERTVAWLADEEVRGTFGLTRVVTLPSHRAWLSSQADLMMWAIILSGDHIGNVSLQVTDRHRSACLQIYLGQRAARGAGVGSRSMSALLDHAFGTLGLHRVWLHTAPENAAAIALYRSCGFLQEGVERQSVLAGSGFRDQIRWSLLATEWASRRA